MRVVHLESLPEWIKSLFEQSLPDGIDLRWLNAGEKVTGAEIIVTGKKRVDDSMLQEAGRALGFIQVQGRAPWAVDLSSAASGGVMVSCLPHRGAIAVAEHAMALALAAKRKIVLGHTGTVNAAYRDLDIEPIRTSERKIAFNWLKLPAVEQLYGDTLGLVGLGDIGLEVARRAQAFDMEVVYHKRSRLSADAERLAGVRYLDLPDLLAVSDVVSLHAPHTSETEGLMDASAFAAMKSSAILINTARGGLVEEAALVDALRRGVIAGAGLDVYVDEPLPIEHALMQLPNVTLSPHTGGGTGGGQRAMVADVIDNLLRFSRGETPKHLVT